MGLFKGADILAGGDAPNVEVTSNVEVSEETKEAAVETLHEITEERKNFSETVKVVGLIVKPAGKSYSVKEYTLNDGTKTDKMGIAKLIVEKSAGYIRGFDDTLTVRAVINGDEATVSCDGLVHIIDSGLFKDNIIIED